MIAIVDYGAGNLQSVQKALNFIGAPSKITANAREILAADGVILPGVGSFADAMASMRKSGLVPAVTLSADDAAKGGRPFLGICLGLQLLFGGSDESPGAEGLGIFEGKIAHIPADGLKVPHMGWNSLDTLAGGAVFGSVAQWSYVYFVHSYYLRATDRSIVAATTHYGVEIDAAVSAGNLYAMQFHPEKSGAVGLKMLRNFAALCGNGGENNVC